MEAVQIRQQVSWVNVNGVPAQEGKTTLPSISEILKREEPPDLLLLRIRDPNNFVAGGIHSNVKEWEGILTGHPMKERILEWLRKGVDVRAFAQSYQGKFKGVSYNSEFAPSKMFQNHASCKEFAEVFADEGRGNDWISA